MTDQLQKATAKQKEQIIIEKLQSENISIEQLRIDYAKAVLEIGKMHEEMASLKRLEGNYTADESITIDQLRVAEAGERKKLMDENERLRGQIKELQNKQPWVTAKSEANREQEDKRSVPTKMPKDQDDGPMPRIVEGL